MWPFSRKPKWTTPEPKLAMLVHCAAPQVPSIMMVANPKGQGGAVKAIAAPAEGSPTEQNMTGPMADGQYIAMLSKDTLCLCTVDRAPRAAPLDLPPDMLAPAGLTPEMLAKFNRPAWCFAVELMSAADPIQAVEFATALAQRVAQLADGVVMDSSAYRFFGPDGWHVERPIEQFDCRRHLLVHIEGDGNTRWCHTHGLIKFGRPELEVYDVPASLGDAGGLMLLNIAQYMITNTPIQPGHTLGDPQQPILARAGTRNRGDHWHDTAVLELVDVDNGKPKRSGAPNGISAYARQP